MRIINKTEWRTEDLRRLFARVAAEELDAPQRQSLIVTVRYQRRLTRVAGRAVYNGRQIWMNLPRPLIVIAPDQVAIAHTFAHECAHIRGMHHRDMRCRRYDYSPGWRDLYNWAAEYPIRLREPKPRPTAVDTVEKKLSHAQAMLAKATTRLRRANTILRSWRRKVAYHERRLAAAASKEKP